MQAVGAGGDDLVTFSNRMHNTKTIDHIMILLSITAPARPIVANHSGVISVCRYALDVPDSVQNGIPDILEKSIEFTE